VFGHRQLRSHADPVATTATVLKVVDGDTVDIVDDVRGRLRIRLLGIDTPETKKPGYTVGCWGPEASEFAKSTLLGQRVAFVTDPSQGMYDRFGRTLAYLDKADGWDYSVEAARAGAAHSYVYHGHPSARADEIAAAEQEAKAAGRGLWGPHASPKRRQYHSDSSRCASAQRSRCVTRPKSNAFVVESSNAGLADHHNRVRRTANRHSWVSKAERGHHQVFAGF
jgi:micrococcal nuclease